MAAGRLLRLLSKVLSFGRAERNTAKRKISNMNIIRSSIEDWIEKLEMGDFGAIRVVYSAFATNDAALIRRAGTAVFRQLEGLERTALLRLCERFREYTSLEWSIDWAEVSLEQTKKELPEETYRYVLILGSFHPNGYFRERCLYEMAEYDKMLFWLFFRVNDWVINIRDAACKILKGYLQRVDTEELFVGISAFERLQDCRRRTEEQMQGLWNQIEARMLTALKETDISAIPNMAPAVRKYLYKALIQSDFLTLCELDLLLNREKVFYLKRILIKGILAQPDCTPEWAEKYLADSSAIIRRMAVEFRYEHLKTCWHGLEEMLLDSGRGVREYAVYILTRHSQLDIRQFYLAHLGDENPESAVLGLAEFSKRGNVPELMKCLERPKRRVLKCTLLALGYQEDFLDEELLWHYLLDDRNDISKAAYVSIKNRSFYMGAKRLYHAYIEAGEEHQKRYLLNLLLRESSWERLPCLVRIYRRDMPEDAGGKVMSGIQKRSMYGKLSPSLREDILLALEEKRGELPKEVETKILYDMKFL